MLWPDFFLEGKLKKESRFRRFLSRHSVAATARRVCCADLPFFPHTPPSLPHPTNGVQQSKWVVVFYKKFTKWGGGCVDIYDLVRWSWRGWIPDMKVCREFSCLQYTAFACFLDWMALKCCAWLYCNDRCHCTKLSWTAKLLWTRDMQGLRFISANNNMWQVSSGGMLYANLFSC